jgi:hypothetical protein
MTDAERPSGGQDMKLSSEVETAVSEAPEPSWRPPLLDRYDLLCASAADRAEAVDAFITAIALAWGCDENLSLKGIDDAAARISKEISERARSNMFPGDNTLCVGPPFSVVDVDGILLRHRAVGAPPAADFALTESMVEEARRNANMDRVRIMKPEWLRIPLLAIRDPATDEAVVVDGHHRMIRLWLDGVRTAQACVLSYQDAAPFIFKTTDEFTATCFQGGTISSERLRMILSENPR